MFRWMSVLCLISYLPIPNYQYWSCVIIQLMLFWPILFWYIVCIHVCKLGVCVFAGILCYFVEKCVLTKSIGNYLIDIIHVFAFASLSLPNVHLFAHKLEHRVCTLLFSHIFFFLVFHWFIYFSEVFFRIRISDTSIRFIVNRRAFFSLILSVLYLLIFFSL